MPITELFLGAFIQVLFDRLASAELLDFVRREGIDMRLKEWKKMVECIQVVLDDAEDKQLTDQPSVKSWLEDLRNLAYDIEDLLDEFVIESVESKSKTGPRTSKARSLLPSCCFKLSPREFLFNHKMRSKIEEMDARLREIITRKSSLSLIENNRKQSTSHLPGKPIPTTHLIEDCFVGRDNKKMEILELLTGEENNRTCTDIRVIPIVGMPGLGKTALAQQVFNDDRVTNYFDVKAWACVSDDFDVLSITKSILEITNPQLARECKTLNSLQDELTKNLSGKKFLVVLDDLWDKNYENWIFLLKPFRSGVKGSKIIVTTRDREVASMVDARLITLKMLTLDYCMELFAFHALGVRNFNNHPNLEVLGRKIAEKCKGLPLAVKALAGLLRNTDNPREWEDILNSKIWDISEDRINVLPALKLSYLHLPSHLKRCFAYCAIFPKDYEIQRDELICWWIAEGLVEAKGAKNKWNVGLDYFNDLVNRSLFLKSGSNESQFLMHDLVNDLAKLVAGPTHFDLGEFKGDHNNTSSVRHASFISSEYILPEKFKIYHGMKGLRSFISLDKPFRNYRVSQKVLCDMLLALKYLRVLSLSHYCINEIPDCIGELMHLRYLNLSYTCIKMLPKSIVALYNLEALMLRGCHDLLELPKGMEKLINLRFLDISNTTRLKAMPLYIGKLVGLEMMSKFVVGTGNGSRLEELKDLEILRGELCISDLHMVREAKDAGDANLCVKKGICRLTMQWSTNFENSRNEELEREVLNFLCPHKNLENLTIFYYGGLKFPSWLGSPSHDKLVHLHLHGCQKVKTLPSLGLLPSLKELYIEYLNSICTVGSEFHGSNNPFPSLLTLEFKGMLIWEDWSHCIDTEEVGVVFPRLDRLVIQDCPKLKALPAFISLPSLNELEFKGCNEGVLQSLVSLTSLTALTINDVVELTCLNHGLTSSLIKLEKLEIRECTKLRYLWQDGDAIRTLHCLKRLVVRNCPEFIYFVAKEGDIELPGNLETIKLMECVNLEKLPSTMHTLSSLRDLTIYKCPKLLSFPKTGIPTSMISLNIECCEMLRSLPRGLGIIDLKISGCVSLPSSPFKEGRFLPTTLKRLEIRCCGWVESLAEINLDPLQSLQMIDIVCCENLRSLPQGLHTLSQLTSLFLSGSPALEVECFPPLPPSILKFFLYSCPKIKSLPNQLYRLTCLRELSIGWCESITRFPDGGLPPQLWKLRVIECENMKQPVREWLTPLTSLQILEIHGSVGGVGEEEDLVLPLPSSLTSLYIYSMKNVERLSTSLPPSLQKLWIQNCLKLRQLPQDGLPPSLEHLLLNNCPILVERCKKGTGCYWPLIREIPSIDIE
ncbi:hypothetical protein ACJRO7_011373 [Eucalyptus globulus]|uniref:Disease resistance RPP13-like protein 1 n=1 Tax=Eucalyptus globulus TaxID=34317 RepID=A0ABD3LFV9_EUCGL